MCVLGLNPSLIDARSLLVARAHFVRLVFQLYEQILAENEKLKAQLRDTDLELGDLKLQLEKATQVNPGRAPLQPSTSPSASLVTFLLPLSSSAAEAGALCRPVTA